MVPITLGSTNSPVPSPATSLAYDSLQGLLAKMGEWRAPTTTLAVAIEQSMHDLVPPFDATIARTLLGLETHPPGCQTHASAVDAGSLAAKIAKACNTEKSVLESLADFVCEGLDIHGHNRESYRRLWHGDDPHEFASIKPDLAALGNGVSTEGRFALYAGTLRLFGAPNAELTAMPQPDSESARLYNTLFALPNVSDDTRSRQSTFMLIDSYLDKFEENRGKGTIYAAAHSS